MVHARGLEDGFMRNGHGINRRDLMFNDFVVVGPESDPAGIEGSSSATEVLDAIADAEATFVSRGDNSGTHTKELDLWDATDAEPGGDWYQETGTGMEPGAERRGPAGRVRSPIAGRSSPSAARSTSRSWYRANRGGPGISPEPLRHHGSQSRSTENANYDLAMAYIGWITTPVPGRHLGNYQVNGETLFLPRAVSELPASTSPTGGRQLQRLGVHWNTFRPALSSTSRSGDNTSRASSSSRCT